MHRFRCIHAAFKLSTKFVDFALACTDWTGLRFSAIDDHAVDRRLDSKGPERQEQQAQAESSIKPNEPAAEPEQKPEDASPKADAKASWTDRRMVQGASQVREV